MKFVMGITGSETAGRLVGVGAVLVPLALLVGLPSLAQQPKTAAPGSIRYNRDIRPILSDNCFSCHGPDRNKRMADLRLDLRENAVTRGAIVPGSPEKSHLLERVLAPADSPLLMPPTSAHKSLTPAQKELIRRWIAEGAVYEPHWSYIPPQRPPVPVIKDTRYPVRTPIDAFIMARLRAESILPSPEADRRTLIRRVSLDLIGLPPTTAEVEAFVNDKSANAYEKVVDRLLASPHYGERMAVPWLDVARYADTVGFHGDQNQNVWAYRDYVISAFNTDKPYERFVREQLAGDLLPDATPETRTATCFNRMNMMTREGGAQEKEYLSKYSADRVRTVGLAFLGSTFACAECHDHKYDPISQRDFYAMAAFFADVKQWGVYADYGYTPNSDLKGYNNDSPFPPEITVESPYLKARILREQERLRAVALEAGRKADRKAVTDWRTETAAFLTAHTDGWEATKPEITLTPAKDSPVDAATPFTATLDADGAVRVTGKGTGDLMVRLRPAMARVAAVRLELLPDPADKNRILRPGTSEVTFGVNIASQKADGKPQPLPVRHAEASVAEPRYQLGFEITGVQRGWRVRETVSTPAVAVYRLAKPVELAENETLVVTLPKVMVGRVRVSVSPLVPELPDTLALSTKALTTLAKPGTDLNADTALAYLLATGRDTGAFTEVTRLEADLVACRDGKTPVLVTEAITPATVRVLPRGNWQDESGAIVEPATPHFLAGYSEKPAQRLSRLNLANWLTTPENPLTARVEVNRLWRLFFGNGLSAQPEDLGAQGEWPSHPELLDWLAVEFRDKGWSHKRIVRLIVTSAVYRQSSSLRPELRERDPNNRFLASQNPRRLDAEFVRDNALAAAGLLNRDIGGPPCKPYQPAGYYAAIQFPDRDYLPDTDDRQWRRGIYMHRQRTFPHPMLANFDAPSREDSLCTRTSANTPQQALTLLNDPEFVEAARVFATSLLTGRDKTDTARIDAIYRRALARAPKPKERESLLAFLEKIRTIYRERPDDATKLAAVGFAPPPKGVDPIELAAWTNVCRVVLNLQETITRY